MLFSWIKFYLCLNVVRGKTIVKHMLCKVKLASQSVSRT